MLQSIVDQVTDFDFEILISDDCSTDGTRMIVQEFSTRYPKIVKYFFHEVNVGAYKNYLFAHAQVHSEYVSHMDGDDLMLPGKLQAQVDVLESDPHCTVVWHRMNLFDDDRNFCVPNIPDVGAFKEGKVYLEDVLQFGSVSFHSSTMYRSSARKTKYSEIDLLDWYFSVEYLRAGYGIYLEEILGEYRYGNQSITRKANGENRVQAILLVSLTYYLEELPSYRKQIFIHALIAFVVNMKNRRPVAKRFGILALKTIVFVSPSELVLAFRRFRKINPPIRIQ